MNRIAGVKAAMVGSAGIWRGVAAAMLWKWVFNGEVGNVICRWLLAGSVAVLLPGLIIFFFFQKMFVNKTRRAIAFRLMVE